MTEADASSQLFATGRVFLIDDDINEARSGDFRICAPSAEQISTSNKLQGTHGYMAIEVYVFGQWIPCRSDIDGSSMALLFWRSAGGQYTLERQYLLAALLATVRAPITLDFMQGCAHIQVPNKAHEQLAIVAMLLRGISLGQQHIQAA
ncbi:MAG: hypothetical protein WAX89_08000 [Alphaproteobacteria bacterium]